MERNCIREREQRSGILSKRGRIEWRRIEIEKTVIRVYLRGTFIIKRSLIRDGGQRSSISERGVTEK